MKRNQNKIFSILIILSISTSVLFLSDISSSNSSIDLLENEFDKTNLEKSDQYQKNIIVFFNSSSYSLLVKNRFEFYGGIIKKEWNNAFASISGFAGYIPLNINLTLFQNEFPEANVENDEILDAQMNYASIQSGAINNTWYLDGLKGDTNCSEAVLDTGVNPNHNFLDSKIIAWENYVDTQPISDDNGHGTLISSIISGTGIDPFDSNLPSEIDIKGNYSHTDLFDEFSIPKNYSLKLFSFNTTKINSEILVNSSWNLEVDGIDGFWFELYKNNTLI